MKTILLVLGIVATVTCMPYSHDEIYTDRVKATIFQDPPATVSDIDLPNYLGRWYQMYANRVVLKTYERDQVCITADYGLNLDGTISVANNGRVKTLDGNLTTISGYAYIDNPKEPGKLKLKFPDIPLGDYWILKLGPKEETFPSVPQYQYAVVSTPRRGQLFVLARNVEEFNARFKDKVFAFLEQEGFTKYLTEPIKTLQDPKCKYAGVSDMQFKLDK